MATAQLDLTWPGIVVKVHTITTHKDLEFKDIELHSKIISNIKQIPVWWLTSVIPAFKRKRQENHHKLKVRINNKSQANQGYRLRPCL